MAELTPSQREALLAELRKIDERLQSIDSMLSFMLRAKGVDPEAIKSRSGLEARERAWEAGQRG